MNVKVKVNEDRSGYMNGERVGMGMRMRMRMDIIMEGALMATCLATLPSTGDSIISTTPSITELKDLTTSVSLGTKIHLIKTRHR